MRQLLALILIYDCLPKRWRRPHINFIRVRVLIHSSTRISSIRFKNCFRFFSRHFISIFTLEKSGWTHYCSLIHLLFNFLLRNPLVIRCLSLTRCSFMLHLKIFCDRTLDVHVRSNYCYFQFCRCFSSYCQSVSFISENYYLH